MDSNQPQNNAEPVIPREEELTTWLRKNLVNLLIGAAILGLILWKLHALDVFLAAAGLTLIIFVHELGHFAAAKLCKVRVETFSIGFGPAIPFCSRKLGETTYKLAIIPLGGYVKMLGEGENTEGEEAESDPRSFKNQTVMERMLIISAGVIMNILMALVLFVIVYLHGLKEQPAVVATLEPGGALWRQGIHSGTRILAINDRRGLWFDDVRPIVWGTDDGEQLKLELETAGEVRTLFVEPRQEPGAPFPLLGFAPPSSLTLYTHPRDPSPPFRRGSAAAQARAADGSGFQPGDRIVAMTDPAAADGRITPLESAHGFGWFEFERRMALLAGKPAFVQVLRQGQSDAESPQVIEIPPAYRWESGLRMRMGHVVAIRDGSPAAAAGLRAKDPGQDGDRIVEVEIANAAGQSTLFVLDPEDAKERLAADSHARILPLDPLRLPWLLQRWSQETGTDGKVKLTVLRSVDHAEKRVSLELQWSARDAADLSEVSAPTTPIAINGLGLAYQVQAVVDGVVPDSPAARAGLQPGDTILAVKFHTTDPATGQQSVGRWQDVQPGQWAYVDRVMQLNEPHALDLRVQRGSSQLDYLCRAELDPTCPVFDRGLNFLPEYRIQKADRVSEALSMGLNRTMRMIKNMYINLYAMLFGRVSATQTISGPITLARLSYMIAGESSYKLMLLLALISINLAVVNFLPIPMLDGGHMMFLIYEGLVGRPPHDRVHFWLSMLGLGLVLALMAFVIGLDIWRLIKLWLRW